MVVCHRRATDSGGRVRRGNNVSMIGCNMRHAGLGCHHGTERQRADQQASGEKSLQHDGFEFHGRSP
jgi:hypothetical protein